MYYSENFLAYALANADETIEDKEPPKYMRQEWDDVVRHFIFNGRIDSERYSKLKNPKTKALFAFDGEKYALDTKNPYAQAFLQEVVNDYNNKIYRFNHYQKLWRQFVPDLPPIFRTGKVYCAVKMANGEVYGESFGGDHIATFDYFNEDFYTYLCELENGRKPESVVIFDGNYAHFSTTNYDCIALKVNAGRYAYYKLQSISVRKVGDSVSDLYSANQMIDLLDKHAKG